MLLFSPLPSFLALLYIIIATSHSGRLPVGNKLVNPSSSPYSMRSILRQLGRPIRTCSRSNTHILRGAWAMCAICGIMHTHKFARRQMYTYYYMNVDFFLSSGVGCFTCLNVYVTIYRLFKRNPWLFLPLPDQPFHNFRASRTGDRRIKCSSRTSILKLQSCEMIGRVGQVGKSKMTNNTPG